MRVKGSERKFGQKAGISEELGHSIRWLRAHRKPIFDPLRVERDNLRPKGAMAKPRV